MQHYKHHLAVLTSFELLDIAFQLAFQAGYKLLEVLVIILEQSPARQLPARVDEIGRSDVGELSILDSLVDVQIQEHLTVHRWRSASRSSATWLYP
jgi:hypothetical protein